MEADCCLRIPTRLFKRDGAYVPSPFLFCPFCSERQMWQLELLLLFWTMRWLWAGTHRTEQYIGHWVSGDHRVTALDYTRLPTSGLLPGERTHPSVCRSLFLSPRLLATKCNYWLMLEEAIILCIVNFIISGCRTQVLGWGHTVEEWTETQYSAFSYDFLPLALQEPTTGPFNHLGWVLRSV